MPLMNLHKGLIFLSFLPLLNVLGDDVFLLFNGRAIYKYLKARYAYA